jgi:diguanylate cyclase (GGDEF)-like protein
MKWRGESDSASARLEQGEALEWVMPAAWRYAAAGLLLGVGAPAGALLLRVAVAGLDAAAEMKEHAFFYLYGLIATCIIFGVAGYFVGRRADVLREGRDRYLTLAEHDDLTRLLNARAFRDRYDRAIEHARKFGEPISLLLADVDSLKEINDRGGHSAGNEALRQVARVLERSKRAGDLACRWGGDEFAILMPGADSTAAVRLAQTILDHIRAEQAPVAGSQQRVSITIGVAAATGPPPSQNLFELADGALYEGKRRGRGQFHVALERDSMGREAPL